MIDVTRHAEHKKTWVSPQVDLDPVALLKIWRVTELRYVESLVAAGKPGPDRRGWKNCFKN